MVKPPLTMIDLKKLEERKQSVINLKKEKGMYPAAQAQVVLALDYSGSMGSLYANGTVQAVVEKILPFGLAFDDNGEVDFYLFESGSTKLPENITVGNLDGYIQKNIIGKYNMGGTMYAPVLEAIYDEFAPKGSMFKKAKPLSVPVYVIFITDGNNFDKHETEEVIRKMSQVGIFVQFIGIGNERFEFLSLLDGLQGRRIDNVNFLKVANIATVTDNELYSGLMAEYPEWVNLAKTVGVLC